MLCKAAVVERGHLSRDEKGGRELCRFLGNVGPGKAKVRCKGRGGDVLVMFMEQEGKQHAWSGVMELEQLPKGV